MLEVENLRVQGGDFTVKDISFAVAKGGCHVLLGPTGSGKTLVLETIAGLRRVQKGKVKAYGRDITYLLPEKREIAYLPQDLALFPNMTVRENIAYSLRMKGFPKKEQEKRIVPIAEALEIGSLLDRKIHFLSGGEKQRVALARALASNHKIMLLDEPLSSLNVALRRDIWRIIKELQNKHELTLVVVTHDLEEALFLGDSISLMARGEILQSGEKREVFYNPLTVEAARILGVENYFAAVVEEVREGYVNAYAPSLFSHLFIKDRHPEKHKGSEVVCAIRGGDILIAGQDASDEGFNTFDCVIQDIWDKENNIVLSAAPLENPGFQLQIALFRMRSFAYCKGQKITVKLPPDALIILN